MDITPHISDTVSVAGVADHRGTSLDRLAGQCAPAAAEALRNVLPARETAPVAVAAFSSSI